MILILGNGISMQGTVDEIIEYLQKTQTETYTDSSTGNYVKTNYDTNYSKVDSETAKKYVNYL